MLGRARAQVWSYSPLYRRPRHFHAEPELNFIVHGSARFGVGSRVVELRAGEVLGFPPGQDHVMLHGSSDLVLLAVGGKLPLVSQTSSAPWSSVAPLHVRPRGPDFEALLARAEKVAGCADEARSAELWQMAIALAAPSQSCSERAPHVLTRRTLALIADDLELTRSALAKHARAHPTDISRHFHHDIGVTLVRYRTRLRILSLIDRVDAGDSNLARSALRAGFGSYSQCHRAFTLELGCPPREFFSTLRAGMEQRFEPLTTRE